MIVNKSSKVLDVGCGIGILGIAAAKLFNADVAMSDINKRAVMLSKMNVKLNNIKAKIYQGNLYEKIKGTKKPKNRKYSHLAPTILQNIPFKKPTGLCIGLGINPKVGCLKPAGSQCWPKTLKIQRGIDTNKTIAAK